jgi:hypothetical protein
VHALDLIGLQEAPGNPPPVDHGLIAWATDGVLLSLIILALLGILLVAALREARRPVLLSLLGVLIVSAILRWLLPAETSFTAWPYKRAVPLALAMYEGPVLPLLSGWFDLTIYLDDLIFETNRWMAILSPLVLFLHARKLLRDDWSALAAAALLAVHPSHLRHSASDVLFIQSIFFSSLAFAALYTAIEESRRWWGIAAAGAFPVLAVLCYQSRPLNIIFAPLFLAAIFLTIRGHGVPRRNAMVAAVAIVGTAAWSVATHLWPRFSGDLQSGLSTDTLAGFWATFTGPQNVVVNPWVTPVGLMGLMVAGGVVLWRRGGTWRLKGLFLLGWLLAFFVAHGYVPTAELLVVSRYLLHLATPMILLAAAATPLLLSRTKWLGVALALYLAAVPFIHGPFIGAVGYNQQQEKAFLLASREAIPAGCTVLEYASPVKNESGGWFNGFGSRMLRTGARIHEGRAERAWPVDLYQSHRPDAPLALDDALARIDADGEACRYLYRGFECYIRPARSPRMAAACLRAERALDLETVASGWFPARSYDVVYSGFDAVENKPGRYQDWFNNSGAPIELKIFRIKGRR